MSAKQRSIPVVIRMSHERDARRYQFRARRLNLHVTAARGNRAFDLEADAVIGARMLAILELGLRHGRTEVDIPERWRLELIGDAAIEQTQERGLRYALRRAINGRVGPRPVDRQPEIAPQVLERFLVLRGQPVAQLDEVRP